MMHADVLGWIPQDTIGLSINSGEELGEWIDRAVSELTTQRQRADTLEGLLQECLVKLVDVQGTNAPKYYASNLIPRVRAALDPTP